MAEFTELLVVCNGKTRTECQLSAYRQFAQKVNEFEHGWGTGIFTVRSNLISVSVDRQTKMIENITLPQFC